MSNLTAPFLEVRSFQALETEVYEVEPQALSSPFRTVYEVEGFSEVGDPEAEAYMSFLNELYEQEMDEALYELMDEARGMHEESYSPNSAFESERMLEQHFAPLQQESERMLESMAQHFANRDPSSLSEAELEVFEAYQATAYLTPAQEDFFGSLKKLAKKAVKGYVGLAKKGLQFAAKLGLGPILKKLLVLVKPLLKRVLQMAIGKLPVNLQPIAQKLAEKYAGIKPAQPATATADATSTDAASPDAMPADASTGMDASTGSDTTTPDATEIQQEFNYQIANLVFAPGEVEQELEVARVINESRQSSYDAAGELDVAREQFINELQNLKEGEDPTPYVQNFIPALLPILKVGLRLAGRPRIVNYIAGLVAKLIQKFVDPQNAKALSRAIVDTGLRLINLEVTEQEEERLAPSTVAATVEETIRKVAAMPEYVLENQELLEAFTLEAFEQAAASYLPPILPDSVYRQRPDLQEGRSLGGTVWLGMPFRSRKCCYRKCPRSFKVRISPQMAEAIETFEGETLSDFFYEQMGLPAGETVEAEVHLYEATNHTSLGDIVRHESEAEDFGASGEAGTVQLHPLTPEVAGLLLDDPSLGREMPAKAMTSRQGIGSGQRMYRLGLSNTRARPLMVPGTGKRSRVRRRSGVKKIRLDFQSDQIGVYFFLSETRAQQLAVSLRKQTHAGTMITTLKRIIKRGISPTLGGLRPKYLQIVGGLTPGQSSGSALQQIPGTVRQSLSRALEGWLLTALADDLKQNAQSFIKASEDPADGITIKFMLSQIPGFSQVRTMLKTKQPAPSNLGFQSGKPTVKVTVGSGFRRD
jgi:hypothetical protein